MSEDGKGTGHLRITLDVSSVPSGDGPCRARCPELDVEVSDPDAGEALLSLASAVVHRVEMAARGGSTFIEALCRMLDGARLIETSPEILRDLLGRRTIDGFAHVEVEAEDDAGRNEGAEDDDLDDDLDEESARGEVFLVRVDGTWHALWAAASAVHPAIYCAREDGPTWHLVPASGDCSAICADPASARPSLTCELVSAPLGVAPPVGQEEGRVTRVVDAATGEVLLELGVEWYQHQSRPVLPLALSVSPERRGLFGEPVVVVGRPIEEGTHDVRRLIIVRNADHWVVEDVLVGEHSQLEVGHGDLPGTVFSPEAAIGLCIEPIDSAHPLSVRVRYTGPDPSGGELYCVAMLEAPWVTRLERRIVVGGSWSRSARV